LCCSALGTVLRAATDEASSAASSASHPAQQAIHIELQRTHRLSTCRRMHHSHLASGIHVGMACGARNLPSIEYDRNAAWLQLAALATSLTAWLRDLARTVT
jgi:hypothetical protein